MGEVNHGRQCDRDGQFDRVPHQTRLNVRFRVHFSGQVKRDAKHDKTVKELRNYRRSRTAQPKHFLARPVLDEVKNRDVNHLRNQKRGDAPYNDPHALPKDRKEIGIGHAADPRSWNLDGHVQQNKAIRDKPGRDERQFADAFFAKIFIDQIGGHEHDWPRQNPDTHRDAKNVNQFRPNQLGHDGVGDENPGKDDVEGFFFGLEHGVVCSFKYSFFWELIPAIRFNLLQFSSLRCVNFKRIFAANAFLGIHRTPIKILTR